MEPVAAQVDAITKKDRHQSRTLRVHEDDIAVLVEYAAALRKKTKDSLQLKHVHVMVDVIDASYLAFIVLAGVERIDITVPASAPYGAREPVVRALSLLLYVRERGRQIHVVFQSDVSEDEMKAIAIDAEGEAARLDKTMLHTFLVLVGLDRDASTCSTWSTSIVPTTGNRSALVFTAVDGGEAKAVEMEAVSAGGKRGAEEMGPESTEPLDRVDDLNARMIAGFEFFALEQFTRNVYEDVALFHDWWRKYLFTQSGENLSAGWITRTNAVLANRGSSASVKTRVAEKMEIADDDNLHLSLMKKDVEFATVSLSYWNSPIRLGVAPSVVDYFHVKVSDAIRDFHITRLYEQVEARADVVERWFRDHIRYKIDTVRDTVIARAQGGTYPYFAVLPIGFTERKMPDGYSIIGYDYTKQYKSDGHTTQMGKLILSNNPAAPVTWYPTDDMVAEYDKVIVAAIGSFDMDKYKTFEHWDDCKYWWILKKIARGGILWVQNVNATVATAKSKARIDLLERPANDAAPEIYRFLYWNGDKPVGNLVISALEQAPIIWQKNE
jgi:hypothetical protein